VKKITITIDEQFYGELERLAKDMLFDRVSGFLRSLARERILQVHNPLWETPERKILQIEVDNYRELFGYAAEKKLGAVEVFATYAMAQYMRRYPLSTAQKRRVEEIYSIRQNPR
jgi:hypothetical protein